MGKKGNGICHESYELDEKSYDISFNASLHAYNNSKTKHFESGRFGCRR